MSLHLHLNPTSNFLWIGPPHGFGKHIDQVSAHDFETFEVVQEPPRQTDSLALSELTDANTSRAIIYSATSTI